MPISQYYYLSSRWIRFNKDKLITTLKQWEQTKKDNLLSYNVDVLKQLKV